MSKVPLTRKTNGTEGNIPNVLIGFTIYSSKFSTIIEAFQLFFSQDIMNVILLQTNEKPESFHSRKGKAFLPFVADEMEAFIGLIFILGTWHAAKEPICVLTNYVLFKFRQC